MKAWTKAWLEWVKAHVHFEEPALEATLGDYFHEVEHVAARIARLEMALDEAIGKAPQQIRAVIEALIVSAWRRATHRRHNRIRDWQLLAF